MINGKGSADAGEPIAEALRLLQLRIENPDAPRQLSVVAPHLVVRGSTGPAPKSP